MISNYTIITVPQWAIFAAITVMVYGWAEKKRIFGMMGSGLLVLLGIYAGWVLLSGNLVPEGVMDVTDPINGERLFTPDELPLEGRLLPHYWGLVLCAGVALAALITEWARRKAALLLKIIAGSLAILLFFMMMGVVKA